MLPQRRFGMREDILRSYGVDAWDPAASQPPQAAMEAEVAAWQHASNENRRCTNWRFTTDDAKIKLKLLHPVPDID